MGGYRFHHHRASFELQTRERRLLVDGKAAPLGQRALDLLTALVQQAGRTVSRRDLVEQVWPDSDVLENNLNVQVNALRKVLGAEVIATIPGRGYVFTLAVQGLAQPATSPTSAPLHPGTTLPILIGREQALQVLDQLLTQHRVLTLVGPGGVGKTLLARHLLQRFAQRLRHGICFVDVSALGDASLVPGAMAAALGVNVGGGDTLDALASALQPLEVLVLLDGAEFLLDGVARLVARLHEAAPQLRLLVTSQAPLKLAAERVHRLDALDIPAATLPAQDALRFGALALFVERARATDSRFSLRDADVAPAIHLCRTLEGLPLAIELAAWRAPVLGVAALADAMQDRLMLLNFARRDAPPRMQSLRAALEWSHALLSPTEQLVWRRLSVLAGSTGLALLRQVVADAPGQGLVDEWRVVDALATLVERSLVAVVQGWGGEPRYRLLDTPRAFAAERLAASGEEDAVRQCHAMAVVVAFEQAHARRMSGQVGIAEWDERQVSERENGYLALAWLQQRDDKQALLRLLPGLLYSMHLEDRSRCRDMVLLCRDLTRQAGDLPLALGALLAAARVGTGLLERAGFDVTEVAVGLARRCAATLPDAKGLYQALCMRAMAQLANANVAGGEADLQEARALEEPDWPPLLCTLRWLAEVWLADRHSDGPGMYRCSQRLFTLFQQAGFPAWRCELDLVNGAMGAGMADAAVEHGLSVLAHLEGTRHERRVGHTRSQLVLALASAGRLVDAREQGRLAWPLAQRQGQTGLWADGMVLLAAREQRHEDAAQLLGYANRHNLVGVAERTLNEAVAVRQALALMRQQLDPETLARLEASGRALRDEDIPAIAFAPPPAPTPSPAPAPSPKG